jgi:hypothetical protein
VLRTPRTALLALAGLAAAAALAGVGAPAAHASQIVDRDAADVRLAISADSRTALVTYTKAGKPMRVLAGGAMNALHASQERPQTKFWLDYSGGYETRYAANPEVKRTLDRLRSLQAAAKRATAARDNPRRYEVGRKIAATYRTLERLRKEAGQFDGSCLPYDGPTLPWFVTACKAPDGSYWALQSWQRMLPNLGLDPWKPEQSVWELHLSHWSGPLPELEVHLDWVMTQKARHLFGRFSYLGVPVHGFKATPTGNPLDSYGRNIYLDVLNAPGYGPGWRRENSFLAQNPNGNFCYGFYPHKPYPGYPPGDRPAGHGERYRATVIGPGVLPDIGWEGADLGDYDRNDPAKVAHEQQANARGDELAAGSKFCRQH